MDPATGGVPPLAYFAAKALPMKDPKQHTHPPQFQFIDGDIIAYSPWDETRQVFKPIAWAQRMLIEVDAFIGRYSSKAINGRCSALWEWENNFGFDPVKTRDWIIKVLNWATRSSSK